MQNYIEAGKLRHRVTIVDPTVVIGTQDGFGEIVSGNDFPVVAENIPAAVEFVSARLTYASQMFVSQVTHRVTIRWMAGIRAQQEVVFLDAEGRTRNLQIQFIDNPDERKHLLILSCLERNSSALVEIVNTP